MFYDNNNKSHIIMCAQHGGSDTSRGNTKKIFKSYFHCVKISDQFSSHSHKLKCDLRLDFFFLGTNGSCQESLTRSAFNRWVSCVYTGPINQPRH